MNATSTLNTNYADAMFRYPILRPLSPLRAEYYFD
jgi:hypothetical protein